MQGLLLDKPICLKLNGLWLPIRVETPRKVFGDLTTINKRGIWRVKALDVDYAIGDDGEYDYWGRPTRIEVVDWEDWINLPVRDCDVGIMTHRREIRIPLIYLTVEYKKMPESKPTLDLRTLYDLHDGVDSYTGKKIPRHRATKDHVIPRSRGGKHTWSNVALADVDLNNRKGNQLNSEAGLPDPKIIVPNTMKAYELIRPREEIPQWNYFLVNKKTR